MGFYVLDLGVGVEGLGVGFVSLIVYEFNGLAGLWICGFEGLRIGCLGFRISRVWRVWGLRIWCFGVEGLGVLGFEGLGLGFVLGFEDLGIRVGVCGFGVYDFMDLWVCGFEN